MAVSTTKPAGNEAAVQPVVSGDAAAPAAESAKVPRMAVIFVKENPTSLDEAIRYEIRAHKMQWSFVSPVTAGSIKTPLSACVKIKEESKQNDCLLIASSAAIKSTYLFVVDANKSGALFKIKFLAVDVQNKTVRRSDEWNTSEDDFPSVVRAAMDAFFDSAGKMIVLKSAVEPLSLDIGLDPALMPGMPVAAKPAVAKPPATSTAAVAGSPPPMPPVPAEAKTASDRPTLDVAAHVKPPVAEAAKKPPSVFSWAPVTEHLGRHKSSYISGGSAAAAFVGSGILWGYAVDSAEQARGVGRYSEASELRGDAESYQRWHRGALVGAFGLIVTAAVLAFLNYKSSSEPQPVSAPQPVVPPSPLPAPLVPSASPVSPVSPTSPASSAPPAPAKAPEPAKSPANDFALPPSSPETPPSPADPGKDKPADRLDTGAGK